MRTFDAPTLQARRDRLAHSLKSALKNGDVALFYSGEPIGKPGGLDQTYPFIPHPEYLWLTGLRRPFGVLAFDLSNGWTEFVWPVTATEALWEGSEIVDLGGRDVATLEAWLSSQKFSRRLNFGQAKERSLENDLQELINRARRPKDAAEIALVRKCASLAARGYARLSAGAIRPGVTERDVQIEYESEVLRAGSEKFPYDTIVGAGTNSAILHAIPTSRVLREQELVLVDAGADINDYCVDITRTYSSSGKFTSQQQNLYDLVLKAQRESISMCKPGVRWTDVHRRAALVLAGGLKDLGLLRCSAEEALETTAIATFLPHGVGHMVGLKVRDVGSVAGKPPAMVCGVRIRVDLELEENFIMTVEPGLYFVQALLDQAETRAKLKDQIHWSEVEKWRSVGGIRIEDDILVKPGNPENLTDLVTK